MEVINDRKKMLEQWKRWYPVGDLAAKYYVDSISDTIEGFTILLLDANNKNKRLQILFEDSIYAYRSTDETFRHSLIVDLSDRYGADFYGKWTFFKVTNSLYIKWLSEQSCGISDTRNLIHFSLIAADSIVDVIDVAEPTITLI
jgi:hypothetical protein